MQKKLKYIFVAVSANSKSKIHVHKKLIIRSIMR